ncbi:MAG: hypothetical protein KJT03_00290 [Verrucomicrobiae bacterium]|nr:hypothetical protein [Verrucomicrobiae bacterium]
MFNLRRSLFHPVVFIPLLLITFIVAVVVAKILVWPIIKDFQAKNYKSNAKVLLENENYRNAFIEIRKAILKDPTDIESFEIALKAAEQSPDHYPYVPGFLAKLMEMDPDNPDHFVKYILLTLQLKRLEEAQSAFDKYPPNSRDTQEYHQLGYSIGIGTKNPEMADKHLSRLVELRPDDLKLQFTLSTLRLNSSENEELRTEAANSLKDLANQKDARIPALRVLLTHSLLAGDREKIKQYVEELSSMNDLLNRDYLLILQCQKFLDEGNFESLVDEYLLRENTDPNAVSMTIDFLLKNDLVPKAETYLDTLPSDLKGNPVVAKKASQIYFITKDYDKLKQFLLDEDWSQQEYGRFLLLALTSQVEGDPIAFRKYWQQCLLEIGTNKSALELLYKTVSNWGWENEGYEVLEKIFFEDPAEDEIFQLLVNHYMSSGQSDRALDILARRLELLPNDHPSKNNYALLSLLNAKNTSLAFTYARNNFEADNSNPYYTTTWAFALQAQDRAQEALNVLEFLSEEERNDPQRAVYIAKIYFDAGQPRMAQKLLEIVNENTLFEEEKFLLRSLQRALEESSN